MNLEVEEESAAAWRFHKYTIPKRKHIIVIPLGVWWQGLTRNKPSIREKGLSNRRHWCPDNTLLYYYCTMKTSSTVLLMASLLILGEVQGFSRAGKQQLGPRPIAGTDTGRRRSSRLFHRPILNPNQELLNNRHSASDWLYNVKSLPQSDVLREIRKPVMAAFVWACIVSVVQTFLLASKLGPLRMFATKMAIPTSAHSFLVSTLGLLLVFRTNSAYQRFNASIYR